MKITVTKVIRELEEKYGWQSMDENQVELVKEVVRDTLKVVDEILRAQKNITIR